MADMADNLYSTHDLALCRNQLLITFACFLLAGALSLPLSEARRHLNVHAGNP